MKKILFTVTMITLALCSFAQTASQYKIANKIKLEGDMSWDYIAVDDDANRLYASHGDRVQVVDLGNNNTVLATITGVNGVHGIAIASEFNEGFISSGKDSSVLVFNLKTFATIAKIKVIGANPDCILYDSFSKRVFTFNGRSKNSTVIDAKNNSILGSIDLPGKPEFAVTDGRGKIYDNIEDKNVVCEIDASSMKVLNSWSIAPGDGPSGLAMDIKNRRLFSVCDKLMVILDADNGKIIKTLPIGDRVDAVGFDANLNRAYSSNGDATLTVVQENNKDDFSVLENVTTQKGARTCCVNSKTHHIYLPCAEFGPAPAPTAEKPKPKPSIIPGSFMILDVEYTK